MTEDMAEEREETGDARETREAVTEEEQEERHKEVAVEPCLGDEEKPESGNDGAARTGQDPPVQAGRQESNMGAAEGRYWRRAEKKRSSVAWSLGKGRAATQNV